VLGALWMAMLFVFAYVDIFAFFRKDVLRAALDGRIFPERRSRFTRVRTAALLYI